MDPFSFAPRWVLNIVCGAIAQRYVEGTLPLEAYANRMSAELKNESSDCSPEKLRNAAEAMLFFLAEIEDDNAIKYCKSFIYFSTSFDVASRPRKLKGFFYNPLSPSKELTTSRSILYAFRAFVFRMRSDPGISGPEEWTLADVEELKRLNDIITVEVVFSDAI
jgi:hypothetical protein